MVERKSTALGLLCALILASTPGLGQSMAPSVSVPVSVNAGLVLDAAGPQQRKSLNAVYLIVCPKPTGASGGTRFLIDGGNIVTNAHVVDTCTEKTLIVISSTNVKIGFTRAIIDADRDLAILVPSEKLSGGFKLAANDSPEPGTAVTTWGYPFVYDGVSPLLSVGYVAGFREENPHDKRVKHIVVNGAFNHGNSGGPLLVSRDDEVIGIVVLTFHFYPLEV